MCSGTMVLLIMSSSWHRSNRHVIEVAFGWILLQRINLSTFKLQTSCVKRQTEHQHAVEVLSKLEKKKSHHLPPTLLCPWLLGQKPDTNRRTLRISKIFLAEAYHRYLQILLGNCFTPKAYIKDICKYFGNYCARKHIKDIICLRPVIWKNFFSIFWQC